MTLLFITSMKCLLPAVDVYCPPAVIYFPPAVDVYCPPADIYCPPAVDVYCPPPDIYRSLGIFFARLMIFIQKMTVNKPICNFSNLFKSIFHEEIKVINTYDDRSCQYQSVITYTCSIDCCRGDYLLLQNFGNSATRG